MNVLPQIYVHVNTNPATHWLSGGALYIAGNLFHQLPVGQDLAASTPARVSSMVGVHCHCGVKPSALVSVLRMRFVETFSSRIARSHPCGTVFWLLARYVNRLHASGTAWINSIPSRRHLADSTVLVTRPLIKQRLAAEE